MENFAEALRQWLTPLHKNLPEIYVVGGAVRDHLLSQSSKDIDLVCHDAEDTARKLAAARNAALVPFEKKADEPCFRVVDRDDPSLFIDITPIRGGSIFADLERRDFTINAVAIQVKQGGVLGNVIDPLNGTHDIKQGIIRITGPDVFVADPLRMLRAVRFAAKLDFTVQSATMMAMKTYVNLIENVASERILTELIEIFKTRQSAPFVRLMDTMGILDVIFPEIRAMKGCTQNFYHHLDVWNHSLLVLEHCEHMVNHPDDFFISVSKPVSENLKSGNRLPLLKLTAMLHDVGKPATRAQDEDTGRITFYGHDRQGGEIVSAIAQRLKMSGRDQEFIHTLAAEHMHILGLFFSKSKSNTQIRWFRKLTDDSIPVIILGIADIKAASGPANKQEIKESHVRWSLDMIQAYYEKIKKQLESRDLIGGKDLIAQGMAPGPEMGDILRKVREAQDIGQVKDREEALMMAKELRNLS